MMRLLQLDDDFYYRSHFPIANLIRSGYILSKNIVSVGSSTKMMIHENSFLSRSFESQVLILSQLNNIHEFDKECLETYLELSKLFKKIKRPDKEAIVSLKKAESIARIYVKDWCKKMYNYVQKTCLTGLYETLPEESSEFYIAYNKLEDYHNKTIHTYIIDVLANKSIHENLNSNIWMFPLEFYTKEIAALEIDSSNTNATENNEHYLINVGYFPTFLSFSGNDLISIANSFHDKNAPFQLACEEWCNQCYKGGGRTYFNETVLPFLPKLASAFEDNDWVNYKLNTTELKFPNTLYVGEVSPIHVWNYYRKTSTNIEPEIDALIKEYTETGDKYTIPVFIFKDAINYTKLDSDAIDNMEAELLKIDETVDDLSPISQKKYFDIDDL